MSSLAKSALSGFAFLFGTATILRVLLDGVIGQVPFGHPLVSLIAFAAAVQVSVAHVAGQANDGLVARVLMLRRGRRAFVLRSALLATALYAVTTVIPAAVATGTAVTSGVIWLLPMLMAQVVLGAVLFAAATDAEKAFDRLRAAQGAYRGSAAASRASASIPAQSPLTILPFGATQLPPTQTVFANPR